MVKPAQRSPHRTAPTMAVSFLGMGGYMFYSSRVSKLREREQLLDLISWQGDERAGAVREIARVLKPCGACILADVRHEAEYASVLRESGVTDHQRHDSGISSVFFDSFSGQRTAVRAGRKQTVGVIVKTTASRRSRACRQQQVDGLEIQ